MNQNMNRNRLKTIFAMIALMLLIVTSGGVQAMIKGDVVDYAVIVNKSIKVTGDTEKNKTLVQKLFLKERGKWPGGKQAKPFGRKGNDQAHLVFRNQVLGMTEAKLAQHWIDLKQKTGESAPREVKTESMLLKFVGKYDGAFGVVTKEFAEKNKDKVSILITFSGK